MTDQAPRLNSPHFFDWFGLPLMFEIEQTTLLKRYRQLQQQHHPDLHSDRTDDCFCAERLESSQINEAYDTLRFADRRAAYILQLNHQDQQLQQSISDMDFLQHALELREQLDDATTPETLDSLRDELKQWITSLSREFTHDLTTQDWPEARDTARKLAFIQKVLNDVARAEDRLDGLDDDDVIDDEFN